ncbi:hypothetical protein FRD01_08520 [Microvenator marinus]|jgi:hypothetical protein|uniref:Uncharacterized protein n=1 Tax=Microvenator marinus TaxID=2600177 RepID=A0A5B8XP78_9DELT|nr:hypothetical protein [Microvenator marinus]QED27285.1 hypothetical protein FRD01_08520 [Microvenator marinus]
MSTHSLLKLYDALQVSHVADVKTSGLDVLFPQGITWSEVLDCRITPFSDQTVEENCEFATEVHKFYILRAPEQDELG